MAIQGNMTKKKTPLPVKSELEKAQNLLQAEKEKRMKIAETEFNDFITAWSAKHNVGIMCTGHFHGNQIQTSLQIVEK